MCIWLTVSLKAGSLMGLPIFPRAFPRKCALWGTESLRSFTVACTCCVKRAITLNSHPQPLLFLFVKANLISNKIWEKEYSFQLSSVQLLSHIRLFVTPQTAALQASLSITNSWSLLKLMSIESVMPSNRLILCQPPPPFCSCLQSVPASGSFQMS